MQNINSSSSTNVNIKEETKIPTRLHLGPIEKVYGLCINEERRKNLEKYEKLFDIDIDTSLSENSFVEGNENKSKKLDMVLPTTMHEARMRGVVPKHIRMKQRYIETNQIVKDWSSPLGAIGCTLSFSNIYKDIVANGYSYALIFEDDIDWNEEFYGECSIESFQQQLNKIDFEDDWDLFYIGTESMGDMSRQRHIKDNIFELEHGRISIPITDRTYKSFKTSQRSADPSPSIHKNFGGQQAFILSYKGAIQLLKYHDPAYAISDGILCYAICNGDIKHRSFLPTLFTQISHPRIPKLNNKLWASLTGINKWHPMQKYNENMCKIKKGCSGWPMSKKYGKGFDVKRYKLEGNIEELDIEESQLLNNSTWRDPLEKVKSNLEKLRSNGTSPPAFETQTLAENMADNLIENGVGASKILQQYLIDPLSISKELDVVEECIKLLYTMSNSLTSLRILIDYSQGLSEMLNKMKENKK